MVQGNFISPASRGHEVLPEEDEASHLGDLTGLTPRALQKGIARACSVASAMSHSVQPHGQQPTRLPRPQDSPGNIKIPYFSSGGKTSGSGAFDPPPAGLAVLSSGLEMVRRVLACLL